MTCKPSDIYLGHDLHLKQKHRNMMHSTEKKM